MTIYREKESEAEVIQILKESDLKELFVEEDGKKDSEIDEKNIRVLIMGNRYAGEVHPKVRISSHGNLCIQYGKHKEYIATDEELEEAKKKIKGTPKIQRFKGLGEMDPDQLEDTTMNADKRTLIRVTISDALLAEKRVNVLMGDDVDPRKEWINENVDFTLEDDFKIKGDK